MQPRGRVTAASPGCWGGSRLSLATTGRLRTSPGCRSWMGHVAVAGSCPLGMAHRGILWQTFPKAPRLFSWRGERRCSPPPPVAPANWFPAGSSDRLPKDGSSKPGTAGGEREGCNTLSILPSAEYCLGKTMRPFFKCNLREILAFPARTHRAVPAWPGPAARAGRAARAPAAFAQSGLKSSPGINKSGL